MYRHKKCRYGFAASYRFVILDTANMGILFGWTKKKREKIFILRFSLIRYKLN